MADPSVLPAGGRTREEIAKIEIGRTTVAPGIARGLVAFFLVCIVAVPVIEIVVPKWISAERVATVWLRLGEVPAQMSAAVASEVARGNRSLWKRVVTANRAAMSGLLDFENALEDESVLGRTLRPPAQLVLTRWLGAGNERVYVGRQDADGARWLFYRQDLEYVTGRGFLEADVIRRRVAAASEWTALPQPDPRPAILEFHRQLQARGIPLIVMPTPVKPGVHPEKLVASYPNDRGIVQNASYGELMEFLRNNGVLVFDPGEVLANARQSEPQFLATDTHWRPEAMERVVERLAAFIGQHSALSEVSTPALQIEELEVANVGDTVVMLDLPREQRLYPPERVLISRVVTPEGPWRSDRAADVLVLGDSFSNIYSLESMGWGSSAGLVEHLSYVMRRPIDRIVQNDDAAFATREMLQRAGWERLAGKRVVIWQFAARELASGNWKVIK
jgi:SGNH hydrolase-like domain, acetyltransferase AlgX